MMRRMEGAPVCYGRPTGQEVGGRDLPEEWRDVEAMLRPDAAMVFDGGDLATVAGGRSQLLHLKEK
jgi:hypothetical protein